MCLLIRRVLKGIAILAALSLNACFADDGLSGDVEFLFSHLGPHRSGEFYAGDTSFLREKVSSFAIDEDGFASLRYRLEIRNSNDEFVALISEDTFAFQPAFGLAETTLKGHLRIPSNTPPGSYKVVSSIKDKVSGRSLTLTKEFKVLKIDKPVPILIRFTTDPTGNVPASGRFVPGEQVFLHFSVAGMESMPEGASCQSTISFFTRTEDGMMRLGPVQKYDLKPISGTNAVPVRFMFTTEKLFQGIAVVEISDGTKESVKAEIPIEVLSPLRK